MRRTGPALATTTLLLLGCVIDRGGSLDVGDEVGDFDESGESGGSGDSDDSEGADDMATGESSADESDSTDTGLDSDTGPEPDTCVEEVDILFVMDNSGSMHDTQVQVVGAIETLVGALDAAEMDWRIGVTTTDNGNMWCPTTTTTPERGKLVATSCKARLDDFLFSDDVDVQDVACNDLCDHVFIELEDTMIDGVARPGTWVERIDGVANTSTIGDGGFVPLDPVEALSCILPQGVAGCEFESQLESMRLALARSQDVSENQFGFLRPGAQLVVVIVSDETDCSTAEDWETIFAQDGERTFWTDPEASFPTDGVCWNAGMECVGLWDGDVYEDCLARDKDVGGNVLPFGNEDNAVLHPISRYTLYLDTLENAKHQIDPAADIEVFGIVGVQADGSITFTDVSESDPDFHTRYGIGPGCTADPDPMGDPQVVATPPGRLRELITEVDGSMHSVCKAQYIDVFKQIADRVILGCE